MLHQRDIVDRLIDPAAGAEQGADIAGAVDIGELPRGADGIVLHRVSSGTDDFADYLDELIARDAEGLRHPRLNAPILLVDPCCSQDPTPILYLNSLFVLNVIALVN